MVGWKTMLFSAGGAIAVAVVWIGFRQNSPQKRVVFAIVPPINQSEIKIQSSNLSSAPPPDAITHSSPAPSAVKKQGSRSRPHLVEDSQALSIAAGTVKRWEPPALEGGDQLSAAAATIRLWEPQAANENQRLALAASNLTLWNPRTPVEVLRNWHNANVDLVRATAVWQKYISGISQQNVPMICDNIEHAVLASHLAVSECAEMTKIIAGWEDEPGAGKETAYGRVSGCFARAAVLTAASDAKLFSFDRAQMLKLVSPLVRRMWYGDIRDANALTQFYAMVATEQPAGSPEYFRGQFGRIEALGREGRKAAALALLSSMERREFSAKTTDLIPNSVPSNVLVAGGLHEDRLHALSVAKCLFYLGQPSNAVSLIDSINPPLGEGEADYEDSRGILSMALVDAKQYSRAEQVLRGLVAEDHAGTSPQYLAMLIENSIRVGDSSEARSALSLWRTKIGLSTYAEADYLRRIEEIGPAQNSQSSATSRANVATALKSRSPVDFDPTESIGQPLPNIEGIFLQKAGSLLKGHYLLVFYHHDCPQCRASMPAFLEVARRLRLHNSKVQVVFVEVPPIAEEGRELINANEEYVLGRLDTSVEWFVPMLSRVEIQDGIVEQAWSHCNQFSESTISHLIQE